MTTTTNHLQAAATTGHDDLGTGDPTLLFLPGWCGDRTVHTDLARRLATGRRVVSADLRGHGGNRHQSEDFTAHQQVDDLVDLLEDCGVERVVPVALSHAGWMAVELRRRLGADRVPGLVLMDWMVLGTPPGFTDALAGLQDPHAWREVRGALFAMWTEGVESAAVHAYVASMGDYEFEHWSRAGREIAAAFAREGTPVEALARLEQRCPTLHLYAQPADPGYLAAQQQVAAAQPWFRPVRLEARSHFPMFEVPETMSAEIESFVRSVS